MNSNSNSCKKGGPGTTTVIKKFLCKLCPKNVSDNDNAILCDLCQVWFTLNVMILILLTKNI